MEDKIKKFKAYQDKLHAKQHCINLLNHDAETVAPAASIDARGKVLEYLSQKIFELNTDKETLSLCQEILDNKDKVDAQTYREAKVLEKELKLFRNMPMNEYIEYASLLNKAGEKWQEAKKSSNYEIFKPYLEKIVETNKKIANYIDSSKKPYDVLLDIYESGCGMADYDPYFEALKKNLVPLLDEISKKPVIENKLAGKHYPIYQQRELSKRLVDIIGLDMNCCSMAESEHPYTSGFNKWDVRITTHYYEDNFESSMYSIIHEGGHAMYEMNVDDKYQYGLLQGGSSLGIHESQSRFYENIICRSYEFSKLVLPTLKEVFKEQLKDLTVDDLYSSLNKVEKSLIRIEADELSYSLHVLIRYEIEKLLISGELSVDEAPKYWNKLYKDYLGVDVPNDSKGILQDSHWSGGGIGYFPTYSIGSAYGAQMLNTMQKEFDFYKAIEDNNIAKITKWLKENVHTHGNMYDPKEIIKMSCKEEFNPQYYFDYLKNKFSKLYKL